MITESKGTEIFCIADDFCKEYQSEIVKNSLPASTDRNYRNRKGRMSDIEIITILICFNSNTFCDFKIATCFMLPGI